MRKTRHIAAWMLSAMLAVASLSAQTADIESLKRLEDSFDRGVNQGDSSILGEFTSREQALLNKYLNALNALYDSLRRDSQDLDGMLVVREEIKRLQADLSLSSDQVTTQQAQLAKMQTAFVAQYEKMVKERDERYILFCENYGDALKKLETNLVKADKIDDAVEVREAFNRVMQGELYAAAYSRLNPGHAGTTAEPGESILSTISFAPATIATAPNPTGAELQKMVESVRARHLIYRKSDTTPRVTSKREVLHFTGHKSRSVVAHMSGTVYLQTIDYVRKKDDPDGYTYYYDTNHQIPRFELKCGPNALKGCVVIFDFYKKNGSKRYKDKTEKIPIGDLTINEVVVVDPVGYGAVKRSWYGSSYSNPLSGQYAGYIVSVFDASGQMCFQRTSLTSLAEHARTNAGS